MCAAPPDDAMAAGEHVTRGEVAVFLCVPFLSEEWIFCGEVVFSGDGKASAAVWTACAAAGAGVHGGLPVVAMHASPPDFFLAAVADGLWGEGKIFLRCPTRGEDRRGRCAGKSLPGILSWSSPSFLCGAATESIFPLSDKPELIQGSGTFVCGGCEIDAGGLDGGMTEHICKADDISVFLIKLNGEEMTQVVGKDFLFWRRAQRC